MEAAGDHRGFFVRPQITTSTRNNYCHPVALFRHTHSAHPPRRQNKATDEEEFLLLLTMGTTACANSMQQFCVVLLLHLFLPPPVPSDRPIAIIIIIAVVHFLAYNYTQQELPRTAITYKEGIGTNENYYFCFTVGSREN